MSPEKPAAPNEKLRLLSPGQGRGNQDNGKRESEKPGGTGHLEEAAIGAGRFLPLHPGLHSVHRRERRPAARDRADQRRIPTMRAGRAGDSSRPGCSPAQVLNEELDASLCRVLYLDRQAFSERGKGPFDLVQARMVVEIKQPVHGRLWNSEPAGEFHLLDAGSPKCRV